mmetsp:Transcript_83550/g.233176  ORF Transcript_83550/g.233176 Transcript_83550/m.233176 type:complete len:106 (-) Transcript_83550:161-478(-)
MYFGGDWSAKESEGESGLLPGEIRIGAFKLATPDGTVLDTTGAGDCFRGSFVGARYGLKKTVAESMRWAAAASSLSVEVEGAMLSMPRRRKIERRLKERLVEIPF